MHSFRTVLTSMLIAGLAALSLTAGATSAAAATGTGADFAPSVRPSELHLNRTERGIATVLHMRGSSRFRMIQVIDLDPADDRIIVDIAGPTYTVGSGYPGSVRGAYVLRNAALVSPDGYETADLALFAYAWPLVAGVRSGTTTLAAASLAGRSVLRGTVALAANECAGLVAGTRTVDLDSATLVPVRIVERRGGRVLSYITTSTRRARATDFAPLRFAGRREVHDDAFVRRTPSQVDALVSYPIAMPTALPAGFTLAYTGNGRQGGMLGPEGSFPRSAGVFFARWTYGFESIDLTIRPARSTLTRDWDQSDPFGDECERAPRSEIAIGANTGHYAAGEVGAPRLWWRDGTTLYTLSGPYSAEQLATIARSLTPVAG